MGSEILHKRAGGDALSTQSGAVGLAKLDPARRLRIGMSSLVSIGNKADVDEHSAAAAGDSRAPVDKFTMLAENPAPAVVRDACTA